jgi:hypothetical protein
VATVAGSPLAGQAPGVVKIRLSGALPDIAALASLFDHRGTGIDLMDISQPYPNRRDPGARLYLTIRLAAGQSGTGAQPPHRPADLPQLTAREDS